MKQYGLIGHPLSHSFSQKYFIRKFEKEGVSNCSYELYDINNINQFTEILTNNPKLRGLNVTIPYKESILQFLTQLDDNAREIGAVNTIKIKNDSLIGYNTDYYGFKQSLKPFLENKHERALILGTGGAAKTVKYVLNELNITCLSVSRTPNKSDEITYEEINEYVIKHHLLIVNTTPIGMFPNVNGLPKLDYKMLSTKHLLYDLIYNPIETQFLKKGKQQGCLTINGMDMLIFQAEKSWEIWNS